MGGRFVLEEADAALDGGSIFLTIRDRSDRAHQVELVQPMFLAPADPARLPGRLYVDGKLIAVRSEQERMLLDGLREAMGASAEVPGGSEFVRGSALRRVGPVCGLAKGTGQQK